MLRFLSLTILLTTLAIPAIAKDDFFTVKRSTASAAAGLASCAPIIKACKEAGYREGNAAKELYGDCVAVVANGKQAQGVNFNADTAGCRTDIAYATAPAVTSSTTTQSTSTTISTDGIPAHRVIVAPATIAPSAGTTTVIHHETTTIPAIAR